MLVQARAQYDPNFTVPPAAGAPYPRGTVSANVSACNSRSGTLRRRGKKSGSQKDKDKRQSTGSLSGIVVNGESSNGVSGNSAAPSMTNLNLTGASADAAIATNGESNYLTNGNDVPQMANGQSNNEMPSFTKVLPRSYFQ